MQPMTYEEYLAHHGILGMRWGKRNGPPYPLNESQMTPKERAKNEVSEYAAKAYAKRRKAKIREREQVRKNKFNEKEERRQNRVDERESRRQNRADERELARQNRFDERESDKQNDADMRESWEQYKRGRTYVRKFLVGAGVMAVAGLAAYKIIKTGQINNEAAKVVAKKTTSSSPVITPPTSDSMKKAMEWINSRVDARVIGNKVLKNPRG